MEIRAILQKALKKLIYSYGLWVLGGLIVLYFVSGIYKIEQSEIGILTRFGKVVDDAVLPGLHYALPYPIDNITKLPAKQMDTLIVNDFIPDNYERGSRVETFVLTSRLMPYAISGDNNILNIYLLVKYTIASAHNYLLHNNDVKKLISNMAAKVVIHTLAAMPVDDILTSGKKRIEDSVRLALQAELDALEAGVAISFVEIREVTPPDEVQRSFDEVIQADVEQKRNKNEAETFKNNTLSAARSEAINLVSEATSAKKQTILTAEGAARRFSDRQAEYAKDKVVGKRKLYLEVLKNIYPKLKEIRYVEGD